ncbi:MAG: hypothetical protein IT332_06675 [Ardenticatenales bacterium]|nr:hypothetical protein [Ardenticatenales bacterium]
MRPTLRHAHALRAPLLVAGLMCGLGLAALGMGARTAIAQRPVPLDFGPYLNRYGTRHVVHIPAGGPGASAVLEVTNAGWIPTDAAVVVLATGGRADCGTVPPKPVSVRCLPAIAPKTSVRVEIPADVSSNVFVYSIVPGRTAGCGSLDDVGSGGTLLSAWEAAGWKAAPGEPLAVGGIATSGADSVGLSGAATTGLGELFRSQPGGGAGGRRPTILAQSLAYAPTTGAQTTLTNVDATCARVDARSAGNVTVPTCGPVRQTTIELAPFVAAPVGPLNGQQGQRAVWAAAVEETVLGASWHESDGWASYDAVGPRELDVQGGKLAFPLAMAGLTNERSVLWVSNLHPTATAQIDINMWDSNGNILRFHGDAEGICPGGAKAYDIAALAGEIPPLGGADVPPERQGPRFLALRVDSKSASLPTAPPIAGVVILQGDEGTEAVPGLGLPLILSRISGRQLQAGGDRPRGEARSITVLSGVMNQYGPERRTTTIAVTLIGETRAENAASADIYDAEGKLLIANVGVRASSTTGFFDLSKPMRLPGAGMATPPAQPFRLPVGFIGTVVLRSQQGRGATFGAVAITRAMLPNGRPAPAPATGEAFTVSMGSIVPLFIDPTAPTRTPFPTTRPTAPTTPTTPGEPTALPTVEPTSTPRSDAVAKLWLPRVLNEP